MRSASARTRAVARYVQHQLMINRDGLQLSQRRRITCSRVCGFGADAQGAGFQPREIQTAARSNHSVWSGLFVNRTQKIVLVGRMPLNIVGQQRGGKAFDGKSTACAAHARSWQETSVSNHSPARLVAGLSLGRQQGILSMAMAVLIDQARMCPQSSTFMARRSGKCKDNPPYHTPLAISGKTIRLCGFQ